jgi:DNA-binding MarR family transcriptional regulator
VSTSDHVSRIQEQWRHERPEVDVSPVGIIGRLHRLGDQLRIEIIKTYRRYGLGEGEFDVMAALRRQGAPYELAPGELARHTMVTTGAITKRLDRLAASGLVIRRDNDADGRGRIVGLTDAGLRVIDEAFAEHMRNEARLVSVLSPTERAQLEKLLTSWLQKLE